MFFGIALIMMVLGSSSSLAQENSQIAMEMTSMSHHHDHDHDSMTMTTPTMTGSLGSYMMTREGSGTSWQPESSPHEGINFILNDWHMMSQANLFGLYDNQGGARGGTKLFSSSMGMIMAQKSLGDYGLWSLKSMISLDPLMGPEGYPLLFASGETANGLTGLSDRQHPHDLFMELASSYSYSLSQQSSVFLYGGLPGEPALGPSAFMHRLSASDNPEAPLTHHWLDSTHVTFGVLTGGYIYDQWKIELSGFNGREPNQNRYDIERPQLNSYSVRLTFNPTKNLSLQSSWGHLTSPEQLSPHTDSQRLILSGTYNLAFDQTNWATTMAWGHKKDTLSQSLNGFLIESSLNLNQRHTFFTRFEQVEEDESTLSLANRTTVNKMTIGYVHDFFKNETTKLGIGGLFSRYIYPSSLENSYGKDLNSYMIYVRLKFG